MNGSRSISTLTCLDIAWSNVGTAGVDLDIPDIIQYADIASQWESFRYRVLADIEEEKCYPTSVEIVDLPKDRLAVRPLARFEIAHRLHYEALVIALAPIIQNALSRSVYSSRWWSKKNRLLSPTRSWIDWQRAARNYHQAHPKLLLANTDVSAFYEHIDIDILIDDLRRLKVPVSRLNSLQNFLKSFNQLSSAWGLPQGSDMSGLLSNLYLSTFDAEIRRGKFWHVRYSDDTYIFGRNWDALRGVLVRANKTLRHRHLNLNASKTDVYPGDKVLSLLEDKEKDAIKYGVEVSADWAPDRLHKLFDRATADSQPNVRDIKFCMTGLATLKDDYAVPWLLANLTQIPHIEREVLVYLDLFVASEPSLRRSVCDVLLSEEVRQYPSAQQHILVFMIHNNIRTRQASDEAWRLLLDRNGDTFVREMAARYLGLFGPAGEVGQLKQQYQLETDHRMRRALLVACYESNQCSKAWLERISTSDDPLRLTAKYLQEDPSYIPRPAAERPPWR
jgi:Reverse transcriptase (RNA-dependent DNA polymerase)